MLYTVTIDRTCTRTSEGGEAVREGMWGGECERALGIEMVSQRPFGK